MPRRNLIFDADDTLWENNVLFERAKDVFVRHLAHPTLSRARVLAALDDVQRETITTHGYGVDSFAHSLAVCLTRLRPGAPLSDPDRAALRAACAPIRTPAPEIIKGVPETLRALADRHALFLLTKGNRAEQQAKIEASGLAPVFAGIGIVPEKDPAAYQEFCSRHGLDPLDTWMIGNSPRSDVRPALTAGLGAVLVPHPMTWSLEHAEVPDGHERFRTVDPFTRLAEVFG
ncbi:HAD family hydrolase [Marinitenerispora sediminis]|uniref:Hydrolase n=1 Tax=Marinitenerispora sediminis TaxID=1931232 RepID=A0A368T997_9ACTN|nr:HAD family hydrolase [Marinitenerispora sediminis]RCV53522.1 hydrolase [Marinitenerispora sediminis]RCV57679.1 hydrolase [Marinitenerispora sediminis]RCV60765.1 hydrolase [Marinitenerispora sediminis]